MVDCSTFLWRTVTKGGQELFHMVDFSNNTGAVHVALPYHLCGGETILKRGQAL